MPVVKLLLPPPDQSALGALAISRDGRLIVFSAAQSEGKTQLWLRPLASLEAQPLSGTEGAAYPFWSPDSRSIGFFAAGKLRKIDVFGGAAQVLCDAPDGRGGDWSPRGEILFAPRLRSGLFVVSASGGVCRPLTTPDFSKAEISHRWPVFLPDGRHFLFTTISAQRESGGLSLGSVDQPKNQKRLLADAGNAAVAGRYLLFARGGALLAQPFDPRRLELLGEPLPVAEAGFNRREAYLPFSVSQNGVLVYGSVEVAPETRLVWFDRMGKMLGVVGEPGLFSQPEFSPDGRRIAATREDPQSGAVDVWLDDLALDVASRFTFDQNSRDPVWSPDGQHIAYASSDSGGSALLQKPANGASAQELLFRSSKPLLPTAWSRDGRFLLYQALDPNNGWDLWVLPLNADHKPVLFLQTPFSEQHAVFSPDGKWIAYDSDESGRSEIYVQAFSVGGEKTRGKWQISAAGGSYPKWRSDGKGVFYHSADGMLAEVPVQGALQPGLPQPLFSTRGADLRAGFAVSPGGGRFLIPVPQNEQAPSPATVILNWTASLRP